MPSYTPWYLALFGGLRATRGTTTITRFRSQKFGTLLAYLALNPERLHTRDELLELLWPDADLEAGRTNLRAALSWLRRQFESDGEDGAFLVTQGNTHVRLNPQSFTTDVTAFEKALRTAGTTGIPLDAKRTALEEAIPLYAGPLLTGLYDNWTLTERERLAERYQWAVSTLAETLVGQGQFSAALDYARRGIAADPLREDANLLVVRLLVRSGEVAAARRHYEEFARQLDEQLGTTPSVSLKTLLDSRSVANDALSTVPATLERSGFPRTSESSPLKRVAKPGVLPPSLPQGGEVSVPTLDKRSGPLIAAPVPRWIPANRFVGREREIEQVTDALRAGRTRLLTITGPGGAGKTRLAQESARRLRDAFPGGICFVPLADCRSASDLVAVATTLELAPAPTVVPVQQVSHALNERSGPTLLILDNLEQVVDDAAAFVDTLLSTTPTVAILATSRIRLGLDGEQELSLMPLPLPAKNASLAELESNPSAMLFVDRAMVVRPNFAVTERNVDAITRICTRLDGIPLALELAAAWAQTLTPAQIADRLSHKLDLLVSRKRGVSERHATLRSAIDWSYRLLSADQQLFFSRLSIFRGGWTLEAAEAVCEEPEALEMLAELQERSLIVAVEAGDAMRYRMLETLREFASEQLTVEATAQLARRHITFFLRLADEAFPKLWGADAVEWLNRLEADHDNFRAAIDTALLAENGIYHALEICRKLYPFWDVRGYILEGRRYLKAALALPHSTVPAETRAGALYAVASFALLQAELGEAETLFQECFALMQTSNNPEHLIDTICRLGLVQYYRRNFAGAVTLFQEGLDRAKGRNLPGSEAHLLKCLGAVLRDQGKLVEAGRCFDEALRLYRQQETEHGIAMMLGEMANLAQLQGNFTRAEAIQQEQLQMARQTNSIVMESYTLQGLGTTALYQQDWGMARTRLQESLAGRQQMGERSGTAYLLFLLGYVALRQHDWAGCHQYLRECVEIVVTLPETNIDSCVCSLGACCAVDRGDAVAAAQLFGKAETDTQEVFAGVSMPTLTPMDDFGQKAVAMLGEGDYSRQIAQGHHLSRMDALALVRRILE